MADRDDKGKFTKGHSGNPKGRTKGSISINDSNIGLIGCDILNTFNKVLYQQGNVTIEL